MKNLIFLAPSCVVLGIEFGFLRCFFYLDA